MVRLGEIDLASQDVLIEVRAGARGAAVDASRPAHGPILSQVTRYRPAGVRLGSLLDPGLTGGVSRAIR